MQKRNMLLLAVVLALLLALASTSVGSACCEDDCGGEGCTPGYWKQPHHIDSWVGYSPDDLFSVAFGVGPGETLLDVLWTGGGKFDALNRHAVAALLNADSDGVSYAYSVDEVIAMVQAAYASGEWKATKRDFERENESGCPLH